ncbi:MAG: TIM barrel protein [Candidatus Saccharimonas sp.]|nr:TIM barrel protein [Planctomycetaceae bacterium]
MSQLSRRTFLGTATAGIALAAGFSTRTRSTFAQEKKGGDIRYGLVTYQWAKDWDLPTLIENCAKAKVLGVELRTTHKHGVEPNLTDGERADVRKRFVDSPVKFLGIGSNERYDSPDPATVRKAIEATKAFIELSHDVGGSGVKVKPDSFHKEVPREKTIEQIGKSLNEVAEFATGFGQQIRLEIHGQCCQLPTIKAIMDVADNPNVALCWNSNPQDLEDPGLEHNFNLVKARLGETTHVHLMDSKTYPHQQLLDLYVKLDYSGWWLLEEGVIPADPAAELIKQREMFDKMLADSRARVG